MANYSLVVGSKFNPYSYQEMVAPVEAATKMHLTLEEQLADLDTKASMWESVIDKNISPEAYNKYSSYINDLRSKAELLATQGLSPTSRQDLYKMKARYASDIIPIEMGYKRQQAFIDEQRKLAAQDRSIMFNRNASMIPLDEFIANPNLSYEQESGNELMKRAYTAAQNLTRSIKENPRRWYPILGGLYSETQIQKGLKPEEVIRTLQGSSKGSQILKQILDDVVMSSNVATWNDPEAFENAYRYAGLGLWGAVGETQYQTVQGLGRGSSGNRGSGNDVNNTPRKSAPYTIVGTDSNLVEQYNDKYKFFESVKKTSDGGVELPKEEDFTYNQVSAISEPIVYKGVSKKMSSDEAQRKLEEATNKFSYLGENNKDSWNAVQRGIELEKTQAAQPIYITPLPFDPTDEKKIKSGILGHINSLTEKQLKVNGLIEQNRASDGLANGERATKKEIEKMVEDIDNVEISVIGDNYPRLQLTYEDKTYTIDGIESVKSYNKDMQDTQSYLKDFSYDGIHPYLGKGSKGTNITELQYNTLLYTGKLPSNIKPEPIKGTNYNGIVLRASSDKIIKLLYDKNNNFLGMSTLADELHNNGSLRGKLYKNMSENLIYSLKDHFAQDAD